jgi:hypothetical protein
MLRFPGTKLDAYCFGRNFGIMNSMGTATSLESSRGPGTAIIHPTSPATSPYVSAVEVVLMYAGIIAYIWRGQRSFHGSWTLLLFAVVASIVLRRDSLHRLGLSLNGVRKNAEYLLPLMVVLFIPLLILGFATGALTLVAPTKPVVLWFVWYFIWAFIQEFLAQSYFNNRLLELTPNRHFSSSLVAIMFAAAHIPNPILMPATLVDGFFFAEAFARSRSLWPIVLAHTVGGFLIAAVSPNTLIHGMRVGPGYFLYGLN